MSMGYNVQPTDMQAKAMQYIREGMGKRDAMLKAGYSKETSQAPGRNLLSRAGASSILEEYQAEYSKAGITQQYLAQKVAKMLEAQKTDKDDYFTQSKAMEWARKDLGLAAPEQQTPTTVVIVAPTEVIKKYELSSDTIESSE